MDNTKKESKKEPIKTIPIMRDNILKKKEMVSVYFTMKMVMYISVNGIRIKLMDKEITTIKMVIITSVFLKTV